MWVCKHCQEEHDFHTTSEKANHSRWCIKNPKRSEYNNNLEIARSARKPGQSGNQYTSGKYSSPTDATREKLRKINTGRKHTLETIEKIRKIALSQTHQRVCKKTVEYTCKDGSIVKMDSSWEIKLAQLMDSLNIKWVRPEPINWTDSNGTVHHYFPDFYLPDANVYFDPKNSHAREKQAEKINALMKQYNNIVILKEDDICEDFVRRYC